MSPSAAVLGRLGRRLVAARLATIAAGVAILLAAAMWVIAARAAPQSPYVDLPFLVLSELIIAGAFSLTAWSGWQLRAVDWPAEIGDLSKV